MPSSVSAVASTAASLAALTALTAPPRLALGQDAEAQALLASVTENTVRVQAGGYQGFGFIVGLRDTDLLVATAWHTLKEARATEATVCFPPRAEVCATGSIAYVADPVGRDLALDLVILAVPDPGQLSWRPDVIADADVGDEVWSIGRAGEWWIPSEPGLVVGFTPGERLVRYQALAVAKGVSGAPIVSRKGLVAMHLQEVGAQQEAQGLDLRAIRERVTERVRGHWILLPAGRCNEVDDPGGNLAGRTIVVHLDPRRPDAALQAMAMLHCAGARALPRPVAEPGAWAGDGVLYQSGDLRIARALQRLLAPLGRLSTRLGQPENDAAVWMR